MKRYIRTKDGKIIDCEQHCCLLGVITIDEIIKQSDTIEKLIEVGDLTERGFVGELLSNGFITNDDHFHLFMFITELYTKQGNNYILVARKEDGEWRVL